MLDAKEPKDANRVSGEDMKDLLTGKTRVSSWN
jgi:hypothetical protein